jgi:hypothetical protein
MISPFPGMDPFLELDEWEDFHTRLNTAVSEALAPRIEPRYLVRIERRVYVEHVGDEEEHWRRADVAREEILASPTHLVELDLLRGGERSLDYRRPLIPPLAAADEDWSHQRLATRQPKSAGFFPPPRVTRSMARADNRWVRACAFCACSSP